MHSIPFSQLHDNMIEKLQNHSFLSLEVTPSKGAHLNHILSSLEDMQIDTLVDAFITTDNPLAKMRYSAILSAIRIQQTFNKPAIATMSMRDRNIIGLQSDLLGSNDFDITTFLTLTGDSTRNGDHPSAKGVMDGSSQILLQIIQSLNQGQDYAKNNLHSPVKTIYPFSTVHSYSKDFKHIQKRMKKKLDEHAVAIVTQPVYDIDHARALMDIFDDTISSFSDNRRNAKLIFGIFPVTKYKTAKFLHEKVPGLHIPSDWLSKLEKASLLSFKEEYSVGFELSSTICRNIYNINPRMHLMSANDFDIAYKLLSMLGK